MIVIFLGPPGSGKGTQAEIVAKELVVEHISTGEVLRKYAKEDSDLGIELSATMASGKLVDTDMVNRVVAAALEQNNQKCILDGYPRNVAQADFLADLSQINPKVILIDVSEAALLKRITGRFSCGKCCKIYNKYYSAPKNENECDQCGKVDFVFRKDDTAETLKARLTEYNKETQPLIDYYKAKNMLEVINGEDLPSEITKELLLRLKK